MEERKFVSVIIPCLNEEKFICMCLDSVLANDYPQDRYEILIVDGGSTDSTKDIINDYIVKNSNIKLLDNPQVYTSFAINSGINQSKGEVIIRLDAHSRCAPNYISLCVKYLYEYGADNVGGIEKTKSSDSTLIGKAIAEVLSHPFGVGNTAYRFATSEPVWVDTVWCGCYKKEIFNRVGLFNEKLLYSQDAEFNFRLRKAGGKILCVPSIIFEYFPRSNLLDFINHKIRDGAWAVIPMRFTRRPMAWRHIVPLFFTSGIIILGILSILFSWIFWIFLILAGFYTAIALSFSIKIAKNKGECRYIYCLPFMFFLLHFFYGLGSIMGMLKLIFRRM